MLWTVVRVWAVVNFVGILMATAMGIFLDVTGEDDGNADDQA